MISMNELLRGVKFEEIGPETQANLKILLARINQVRSKWGRPMTVTSGLRDLNDMVRIYKAKAEKAGVQFDESKIPMGSRHLYGQAVDISDHNRELQAWCLANVAVLEEIGLWMEDFSATPTWIHFQVVPPRSGRRFFKP